MNKNMFIAIASVAILFIAPFVIWGVISFSKIGTEEVKLITVPSDSIVKIDNKEYKNKESIRLKPGKYSAVASKEGFESLAQELEVKKSEDTMLVSLLPAKTPEAQQWAIKNQGFYLKAEGKVGTLMAEEGEAFIEKYPVTKWLPLQKSTYLIGYKEAGEGIIITISASEGYREAALEELRKKGADLSDYKIEFNDYRNPFDE